MKRYINERSDYGTETIDEFDSNDFPSTKEFREEIRKDLHEYRMCGRNVWSSQRCCKDWK